MFFKFLKHDLHYGVFQQKGRLLVTFLVFFCLSTYHFWTLRIFELTNPRYFESPVTTGDYFLALVGGCGKVQILLGGDIDFVMPIMWLVFVLWIMFCSLYYPFLDLYGAGKHLMILSGGRGVWWLSKCVWATVNTVVNYLLVFAASFVSGLCFGAKPGMMANWYLAQELNIRIDDLTTETTWNLWPVFLLTLLVLIALSIFQLALSAAAKPLFSYLLVSAYLFAGAYLQNPALLGNYTMAARSSRLVTTGLSPELGALLCLWVIAVSIGVGYLIFQHKDILGGD